jgi:hypothetical protein
MLPPDRKSFAYTTLDSPNPCQTLLFLGAADKVLAHVREFARKTEQQVRTVLKDDAVSSLRLPHSVL